MSFPESTAEYSHLKTMSVKMSIAYGPVESRRFGRSLGVNFLGLNKICSFDCPYCELGLTTIRMNQLKQESVFPDVESIDKSVRDLMKSELKAERPFDTIAISGNGEPTLHPHFLEAIELLITARNDIAPKVPIVVLTNGAHCDSKRVVLGLNLVDERILKIDAGGENMFKKMNRPLVRANLGKITSGARKLKDTIVQSLFVKGSVDNTKLEDLEEWMEVIGIVQPKKVQIYTIDRIPAESGLLKADEDTLYTIESRLKRKLQLECAVFA